MSETDTMRVVRFMEPRRPFALRAVSVPSPGPDQVRVRVAACGVCRTDLHLRDGLLDLGKRDFTVGHEISGTIESCGDNVPAQWQGKRVVIYYYIGCGLCRYCRSGEEYLCPHAQGAARLFQRRGIRRKYRGTAAQLRAAAGQCGHGGSRPHGLCRFHCGTCGQDG